MTKKTYQNITRFSLPITIKTIDGSKTSSFMLAPQKTFEATELQATGDIAIKLRNKLLKVIAEEVNQTTTTEFLKATVPGKATPKVVTSKIKSTAFPASNKDVKLTSKETDNS